jgi:signal transduction histidine kinase
MQDPLGVQVQDQVQDQAQTFASFAYLQQILDSCPYVALVLNEHRRIVFFNRALIALAGPAVDNALFGRKFGEAVQCNHAAEGEGCGTSDACQTCGALLATKEGLKGLASTKECRLVRNVAGTTEWLDVQVTVSPIVAAGERFAMCFVRDVSHEKRRAVLERIFFHDILNSATGVELLAVALKSMVEGDASGFATQIRACATQMVEEIQSQQQLLAAEKDELAVSVVSLTTGSVIREVVEAFHGSALTQVRALRVAADSHDVTIQSDPSILRRVLRNMLTNALEASAADETVEVGCRDLGGEVEFWVHNPGTMPAPVRLQVFQRSFSTKGVGRGLGTYSIKLLSERYLKGAVTFRSTKSDGTRFFARYPRRLAVVTQSSQ